MIVQLKPPPQRLFADSAPAAGLRLPGDAMAGNGALFTRQDAVEAAWTVVEPVLAKHSRAVPYRRGTWGPKEADALVAADRRWHNAGPDDADSD